MSNEQALIPVDQRTVTFYGDEIQGVVIKSTPLGRAIFVPVRPLCTFLGIDWPGQRRRINGDTVLSEVVKPIEVSTAGGPQVMQCIPLEYLNGWLFGINANRVRDDIKERVLLYQRECYKVLAGHFLERETTTDLSPAAAESIAQLQRIEETALAVAHLAREQMQLTTRLDKAAIIVGQHSKRITAIEQQLAPRNAITDEQAADVGNKVQALAMALTENDPTKNYFQAIYAELHRRFRVSSYKTIRQEQYQAVIDFLDKWGEAAAKGRAGGDLIN